MEQQVSLHDLIQALADQGITREEGSGRSSRYRCNYCKCSWYTDMPEAHSHGCFRPLALIWLEQHGSV